MRPKLALSVAAVGVLVALSLAQTVFAHSRPLRLEPPPGAILETPPTEVTGWFTAALRRDPNWNFFRVTDEQGNRVDAGEPILSSDRKQMTVDLQPNLPDGRYLVTWRTWDDEDGRIFGDCFTFFVGQEAADAAITEGYRLDGGGDCERIDFQAAQGTPAPEVALTPQAEGPPVLPTGSTGQLTGSEGSDDDGVAPWLLFVSGGIGIALGVVGTQLRSLKKR